jgi:pimeloyl-ACP methyl ester carboxylesterase
MNHEDRTKQLLASIANRRGIPFRHDRLPTRRVLTIPAHQLLSYLDWPGSGPPLLLLHGGALNAHTWDLVCLELVDNFHCVALDLRGNGDSGHAEEYTIDAAVGDVLALADALRWGRLHIAGMSLGGNVAFHFAAQHAERTASLTMVDVGPEIDFAATSGMRSFLTEAGKSESLESVVEAVLAYRPDNDRDLILYRYMHLMRSMPDGSWQWKLDRRRPPDYPHILAKLAEMPSLAPRIQCPVLITRGARSRVFSEPAAAAFAQLFAHARWTNIADAGHNIQEDNPKALAAAIREHCRAVPPLGHGRTRT